jgi:hypothetical protein
LTAEEIESGAIAIVPISDSGISEIFRRFVTGGTTRNIQIIRAQQSEHLNKLSKTQAALQKKLAALIAEHGVGSKEHISQLELLVTFLQRIEQVELPTSSEFKPKREGGFTVPTTARLRQGMEKLIQLYKTTSSAASASASASASAAAAVAADVPIPDSVIPSASAETVAREKREREKAVIIQRLQQAQLAYHEFVNNYRQALNKLSETPSADDKDGRVNLYALCRLDQQVQIFQETSGVDHNELLRLQQDALVAMQDFCNNVNPDNYRQILSVIDYQKLDHLISSKVAAELALIAIAKGDSGALGMVLRCFELPVLQQYSNPLQLVARGAAARDQNSGPKYALLEWCVELNQSRCFGLLLKNHHRLEHFCEPGSPVMLIFTDPLFGNDFLAEICRAGGMSAEAQKQLLAKEMQYLQQQIDDEICRDDPKSLIALQGRMRIIKTITDAREQIHSKLIRLEWQVRKFMDASLLKMLTNAALLFTPEERDSLRRDPECLQLVAEFFDASIGLYEALGPNLGRFLWENRHFLSAQTAHKDALPPNRSILLATMRMLISRVTELKNNIIFKSALVLDTRKIQFKNEKELKAYQRAIQSIDKEFENEVFLANWRDISKEFEALKQLSIFSSAAPVAASAGAAAAADDDDQSPMRTFLRHGH